MNVKLYYNCILCNRRFERTPDCKIFPGFGVCGKCLASVKFSDYGGFEGISYVDYIISPLYYTPIIKSAMASFKFGRQRAFATFFADCIIQYVNKNGGIDDADAIVSVPLSKKRIASRGFNQSELVADIISKYYKLPYYKDCLVKVKDIPKQSKLNRLQRITNVYGAFKAVNPALLDGKTVVLIDDIATTGSTMNACAKELKACGVKKVIALSCSITDKHAD